MGNLPSININTEQLFNAAKDTCKKILQVQDKPDDLEVLIPEDDLEQDIDISQIEEDAETDITAYTLSSHSDNAADNARFNPFSLDPPNLLEIGVKQEVAIGGSQEIPNVPSNVEQDKKDEEEIDKEKKENEQNEKKEEEGELLLVFD